MSARTAAARRVVQGVLRRIHSGRLEVVEADGTVSVHGPGGTPAATVRVRDPRAWPALLRGSRGLAEAYVNGWWDSDDLVAVVRVAARNVDRLDELRRRVQPLRVPYQHLRGIRGDNTRERSRDHVSAHYDLGNDFFELMLDETMMYSAGVFRTPDTPLHDASLAKLELVCAKLGLGPGHHVVEIGTGWGGFAVHAATTRGCRVTTTTISAEQHDHATRRVAAAGLADRVTVLREDYRDLTGRFDALVSLEMIEAVGWRQFGTFFETCSRLLAPDGAMLLQAITMDDRAYEVEKASNSFIRTMIFPGGCLPSQEVLARTTARHTDLRLAHFEDLSADYAMTLAAWRANVERHRDRLHALGYDERFLRLWRLYLAYCEGGFTERRIGVGQSLLAKPGWRAAVAGALPADGAQTGALRVGRPS